METMSCSSFRSKLAGTLYGVNEGHKPIIIIRQSGKSAVVISLDGFKSYEETAYLMISPKTHQG